MASVVVWRLNAFAGFMFFGGGCARTGVAAMGAWSIDPPSVSISAAAAVVKITGGCARSADCGLVSVTDVARGGLYAARPGFVKRVGWRSSYNPNENPPATARYMNRRNARSPATPSPRDRE